MVNLIEFQNFINNIPTEGFDFEVENDQQNNQKTAKVKLALTGIFGGINFKIKQNMSPPYSIATVTFTGTLSLNCFINGLGVFFSDNVTVICKFNITTGALISGQLVGLD